MAIKPLDLPQDILDLIFPYLAPKSFLSFCSVTKETYSQYHLDPLYWRVRTSSTFRIPITPLLHADGARWHWLYKKLRTQTRPFTWGKGERSGLGPGAGLRNPRNRFRPSASFARSYSSWPTEVHVRENEIGTIVDLQCGGWSTSILTNEGKLFAVGIVDAAENLYVGEPVEHFTELKKFGQYQVTGIRQFSSGRRHILGLDDHGYVFSWDRTDQPGRLVSFKDSPEYIRKATRVVAGWSESSVYIAGRGIVYWPFISTRRDGSNVTDYDRFVDGIVIPATGFERPSGRDPKSNQEIAFDEDGSLTPESVGQVLVHILLEGYVVFVTHHSKLFACPIGAFELNNSNPQNTHIVFEVPGYSSPGRELKDLQGSFRSFGVFTATGEVLSGNTTYLAHIQANALEELEQRQSRSSRAPLQDLTNLRPADVPALQHTGVIALAFGDYHFHALHTNGTITAYGIESGCCGALGLGDTNAGSRFRGLKTSRTPIYRDGRLLPVSFRRGRRVWFEAEKRDWLHWMEGWVKTPTAFPHYPEVFRLLNDDEEKQAQFSEWIEMEGRHWAEGPSGQVQTAGQAQDELQPYFAISIAAAGMHSAALVLVDDEKAEEVRQKWVSPTQDGGNSKGSIRCEYIWEHVPFPRFRLPDGQELPGEGGLLPWREGMPSLAELGLGQQVE